MRATRTLLATLTATVLLSVAILSPTHAQSMPPGLRVSGTQLVDGSNHTVVLRGVDRAGTEYACIQGWGIFDGSNSTNDDSQPPLMRSWGLNMINIGLNEDCWLGINGVPAAYGGANYQAAIQHYVATAEANGLYPVIVLFWGAPGTQQARGHPAVPDNDHAPAFWQSVANTFKADPHVILRLQEEPHPAGNTDGAAAWQCWSKGDVQYDASGSIVPISRVTNCNEGYPVVGMQSLVNIIRGAGATNVIQVPGVGYANSMTHFLDSAYRVSDTLNPPQMMGVVDVYPNGNSCGSTSCWNTYYVPVMNAMPFMAGEFGESVDGNDCTTGGVDSLMALFDQHGAGYAGWSWDTWGGCLQLISSYSTGAPNGNWGNDYRSHVLSLNGSQPTVVPTTATAATVTPGSPTSTSTLASTPTASATPGSYSLSGSLSPTSNVLGGTESVQASVTVPSAGNYLIDLEGYDPSNSNKVWTMWWDNQAFNAGQTRTYSSSWKLPASGTGDYALKIGVFAPGWTRLLAWNNRAAVVSVSAPSVTPTITQSPTASPTATSSATGTPAPTDMPTATMSPTNTPAPQYVQVPSPPSQGCYVLRADNGVLSWQPTSC